MSGAVVIGLGNEWRRDDAAGLAVARALGGRVPPGVPVIAHEGDPTALLELWSGADEVVVVDAFGSGPEPGTVHRLDAGARRLPVGLFGASTHAVGLAEVVELARALGRLPRQLLVYGIEGAGFGAGAGLTPPVERAVEELVVELAERFAGPRPERAVARLPRSGR